MKQYLWNQRRRKLGALSLALATLLTPAVCIASDSACPSVEGHVLSPLNPIDVYRTANPNLLKKGDATLAG